MTPLRADPGAIAFYLLPGETADALREVAGDALDWERWAVVLVYDEADGEGVRLRPVASAN